MIVRTGKHIRIQVGYWLIERESQRPGCVLLSRENGAALSLPGNKEEAEQLCAAYMRAVNEDMSYSNEGES